jgi:YhcH/YjgK/YiaL family protein
MKKTIKTFSMIAAIILLFGCGGRKNPATWNEAKINDWFNKGEWLNGWKISPDASVNKKLLAESYFKNRARWDSAFAFLRDNNLSDIEAKRYDLNGNNLYVSITDYNTRNPEDARYEAHRKYIDIQYVATGTERIGIAPLSSVDSVLQEYDPAKDIEFMRVKGGDTYPASPDRFFVFFPEDAHMPGLKTDTIAPVRKVVVKVKID